MATDRPLSQDLPSDPGRRALLDSAVEVYVERSEDGAAPDPADFVAAYPAEVRSELLERIGYYRDFSRLLLPEPEEAPDPSLVQATIGGFQLLEELGKGGMGTVYLAWQEKLKRKVALKVLHRAQALSADLLERFRREAQAAAKLDHPNIVRVFEVGESDQIHCIAMEHVAGRSLTDEMQQVREEQRGQPIAADRQRAIGAASYTQRAASVVAEVAEALAYAHDNGVIHRDVKPENILIGSDDRPRLVDFGLAKVLGDATLTATGMLAGTPHYMSPEQASSGKRKPDARTDVYSLGVVLFELLTLERPFQGETLHEVLQAIAVKTPRSIRKLNERVPRDLEIVCLKAMERDPDDRYRGMREFAQDLRRFLAHESIKANPPSPPVRAWRFVLRNRVAVGAAAAVVLIATLLPALFNALGRANTLQGELARAEAVRIGGPAAVGTADFVIRELDPITGLPDEARVPLATGSLPFEGLVPAGYYRIDVDAGAAGRAEVIRWYVEEGTEDEIVVRPVPADRAGSEMVLIPATSAPFAHPLLVGSGGRPPELPTIALPAFYIDRYEVSNAEYAAFLAATGRAARPGFWPEGELPEEWRDLPVTGIPVLDAQAFAEWKGKRLPTLAEWNLAARGPSMSLFPWGNDSSRVDALSNSGRGEVESDSGESEESVEYLRRDYLANVKPVRECVEAARSRHGLFHVFGNVAEFTSSPVADRFAAPYGLFPGLYYVRDTMWFAFAASPDREVGLNGSRLVALGDARRTVGFRCVRPAGNE
ncbi:MAG TPA: bifunctional serine/threonine-protein kinase/formylglycine-generating enzyme family protein [Planctomycetota bacterium]